MPYTHFHNWSIHTHHRRPKHGNHYNAVRRRQKPFRVCAWLSVIGLAVGIGVWLALTHNMLGRGTAVVSSQVEETRARNQAQTATRTATAQVREPTRVAAGEVENAVLLSGQSKTDTRTAEARVAKQTRTADAQVREQTRVADAKIKETTLLLEVERKVHDGINAERVKAGGTALAWDDSLGSIARAHSKDMTNRGYFSHDTPEGLGPGERMNAAGHPWRSRCRDGYAENIALEGGSNISSDKVADAAISRWMDSLGHRRNLLDRRFDTTGVGASLGRYQGYQAVYLTQVFC